MGKAKKIWRLAFSSIISDDAEMHQPVSKAYKLVFQLPSLYIFVEIHSQFFQ